jgi:hypothetical protein
MLDKIKTLVMEADDTTIQQAADTFRQMAISIIPAIERSQQVENYGRREYRHRKRILRNLFRVFCLKFKWSLTMKDGEYVFSTDDNAAHLMIQFLIAIYEKQQMESGE